MDEEHKLELLILRAKNERLERRLDKLERENTTLKQFIENEGYGKLLLGGSKCYY